MTTMKLGVTRHGPLAPETFQLGKYDVLTSTGTPVRLTSNDTRSSDVRMRETRVDPTACLGGSSTVTPAPMVGSATLVTWAAIRGHVFGPEAASGTDQRVGSWYQGTDTP